MIRTLTASAMRTGIMAVALVAAAWTASAADLKEVAREHTFVSMGNDRGSPVFLDPGIANPYRGGVNSIRWTIMLSTEPLFWYNNLTDEVVPWIGESVESNDDFTVYTVRIKDGVEWSDGMPFTAEDIKFTYDMLIENGNGAGDLRFASSVALNVASVEVVDPLTVQINLTNSNPRYPFVDLYAYFGNGLIWVPKHIWEGVDDKLAFPNYDPENGLPVTTGAWQLVEYNENQIFLDRRDDWWGAKSGFRDLPDVERIVSIPFGNTDRAIKLITEGTVDFAPNLTDVIFVRKMLEDNPNIQMFSGKEPPYGAIGWWTISLFPNNKMEKWSDMRVRRALNYAIDQQEIVDFVYEGLNPVNLTPFPDFGSLAGIREVAFAKATEHDFGRRDLEKVDALMTEAGYEKNGNGYWTKDGEELTSIIHGIPLTQTFGPFVARQLQDAGFNIDFVS
ncbi:MAG: ABC transporter substrate-binding protein, partial [Pseudomonadota bacterium]